MNSKKIATFSIAAVMAIAAFVGGRLYTKNEYEGYLQSMKAGYDADIEGMQLSRENAAKAYDKDIEGLKKKIEELSLEVDSYKCSDYEDHSDYLDCNAALVFIDEHLEEIKWIDAHNPVPYIYFKDGRVFSADSDHIIVETTAPASYSVMPALTGSDVALLSHFD